MIGPGKYDEETTRARMACRAEGVVLIVAGGYCGDGFSAQLSGKLIASLPAVLRQVADQIEQSAQALGSSGYTIGEDEDSITCHKCGRTSWNLKDVANKYCGFCHQFHQ